MNDFGVYVTTTFTRTKVPIHFLACETWSVANFTKSSFWPSFNGVFYEDKNKRLTVKCIRCIYLPAVAVQLFPLASSRLSYIIETDAERLPLYEFQIFLWFFRSWYKSVSTSNSTKTCE